MWFVRFLVSLSVPPELVLVLVLALVLMMVAHLGNGCLRSFDLTGRRDDDHLFRMGF